MTHTPLTLSRRHVLGDLYPQCERLTSVPVFWESVDGSPLGFVEEGTSQYADAFTFHIEEQLCRKLASGQVICLFNYEFASASNGGTGGKRRIRLTSFVLSTRQDTDKPKT
jgi:hypothetical protein